MPKSLMHLSILLALMLCMLSSCTINKQRVIAEIIGTDHPADYRQGFEDGYYSCYAATYSWFKFKKERPKYNSNMQYRDGWDDGYQRAESEKDHPFFY